ncbi:hypothetical protein FC98_GL001068 [Lentilactobacillus kisonensis DSM 19906 = JCM 15041]|uniref:Uncharacterized protein n=1 Tax=Lentilactobacillus kisonensis DSM 19906 = JCM 15041 TaxID=1423766 RepID=A0A0R1NZP7_9LACO|nr:hypothetical protein FC98_GL001068 [Lentilactobacillus kisonensis DSM 19906 = JCM 15041]
METYTPIANRLDSLTISFTIHHFLGIIYENKITGVPILAEIILIEPDLVSTSEGKIYGSWDRLS